MLNHDPSPCLSPGPIGQSGIPAYPAGMLRHVTARINAQTIRGETSPIW